LKLIEKEQIAKNIPKNMVDIAIFNEIDSTNDEAKRINLSNDFHLIIAEKQTKGRGRHGKKWSSPNLGNIYMTICTENDLSFAPISLLTGLICKNAITKINNSLDIKLKWPNDILFKNKKIGGILVEKEIFNSKIKTIVGIGINIRLNKKETWWGDLSKYGFQNKRNELIGEIVNKFIETSIKKPLNWANEWRNNCIHLNKEIEIHHKNRSAKNVIFKDIDQEGNAIIQTDNGLEIFKSGQINIKGIY
tara:strand:- start:713 stop:1456 length:744 start_codon:yes stop_codon:yes gene_type:complete